MLREKRGTWLLGLFMVLGLAPLQAATVLPMNLADLVQRAPRVFEGRCSHIEHVVVKSSDGQADIPSVRYTFEVLDTLKGTETKTIVISQLGRFQDGRNFFANPDHIGVPTFRVGGNYVLFMGPNGPTGLCAPIGLRQGVFDVDENQVRNRAGNGYILEGMESALSVDRYREFVTKPAAPKTGVLKTPEKAFDLNLFKSLVRDLIQGAVKAPTRQELNK